jgi:hypothetical protein
LRGGWYNPAAVAHRPPPTLDYALPVKTLPPPNDAVGLPRTERLNSRARRAALVTVLLPFIVAVVVIARHWGPIAFALTVAVLIVTAIFDIVLAVGAMRALNYAGRTGPVMAVSLIALLVAASCILLGAFAMLLAIPRF